uniref:Uncharacterized protein n=2 Tax=Zea mays TaxID=4577 RepID=C4J651_MAIZE|nr:unknown [Zea mays]
MMPHRRAQTTTRGRGRTSARAAEGLDRRRTAGGRHSESGRRRPYYSIDGRAAANSWPTTAAPSIGRRTAGSKKDDESIFQSTCMINYLRAVSRSGTWPQRTPGERRRPTRARPGRRRRRWRSPGSRRARGPGSPSSLPPTAWKQAGRPRTTGVPAASSLPPGAS